jgi:5-methylcytosine-specific restriction endonuclease McrA
LKVAPEVKDLVHRRASGCCEYCRCPEEFATQPHSVEHILAQARGGSEDAENLALSCQGCNNHKYTKSETLDNLSFILVK